MCNRKRWLASVLAVAMAFVDCGSIPALAAENGMASEMSVSENDVESSGIDEVQERIPDDISEAASDNKEAGSEDETADRTGKETGNRTENETADEATEQTTEQTDSEVEFPALRIGQIPEGEELPAPDDPLFEYDLPISFETADSLQLFVSYEIEEIPEKEEDGTVVWSILRGEKGTEAGSGSLLKEEDDWTGFEEVSDAPYFILTTTQENGPYARAALVPREDDEEDSEEEGQPEAYDYYIRAAYYPGAVRQEDEAFYAAATLPFLPQDGTGAADAETGGAENEDRVEDSGDVDADRIATDELENTEDTEDTVETADPEENRPDRTADDDAGAADREDADPEGSQEDATIVEESGMDPEAAVEEASSLSENALQTESGEQITKLLIRPSRLTMYPGDLIQLTAATEPQNIPAVIVWESSNEKVATVSENGEVRAEAEGITWITAQCDGLTATARVEVEPADDKNMVVDLTGDIWVAGFRKDSEDFVYTGQKITQDIRVYHQDTLLKENTDYTLTYKNNVNAAASNAANAPSVTVKMKGQYQGSVTLYYGIRPLDINAIDGYDAGREDPDGSGGADGHSPGYEQTVRYAARLNIPGPVLTFGRKKLAVNKDFACDYSTLPAEYKKGDSYEPGKVYEYTVNGIGNFTGSFRMRLVVMNDKAFNFGSASVKLGQKQYEYHGTALAKEEVTVEEVKLNGQPLSKGRYDYEVCANGIEGAYVLVFPSEEGRNAGYRGCKRVNLKLTGDRSITEAGLGENWKQSIPFSQKAVNKYGGIFQAKTGLLTFGSEKEPLVEGTDYTVKYTNTRKAGLVTATFTGKGRYTGSLRQKYEITPVSDGKSLTIVWGKNVTQRAEMPEVTYQKGGASPDFVLQDQDRNVLRNKIDYTVKLKDNKAPGSLMSCEITGKGNYKGYTRTVQLTVTPGDLSQAVLTAADKPYSTKQNAWKSAVTVKDVNGKKLSAGKDYDADIAYACEAMENGVPREGAAVTVTVHGTGYYENSVSGSYRIYRNSIGKLKIVIDPQEYTGEEITLSPGVDIHAYENSRDARNKQNELWGDIYEIVEYKNNSKAGTAKVTLRGIGDYGGSKTFSFKINKKRYETNRIKKIKLNKTSLALALSEKDEAKRTLTATLTAETGKQITNPTVAWTTSDSRIVTVEDRVIDDTTVIGILHIKKEGTVTITATTQDGNKRAQCKVTIVDAPVLKEAGRTIKRNVGETYQLQLEYDETGSQAPGTKELKWESNNPAAVSVDQNGLLTMKKAGAAVIRLYAGNSKYIQECYAVAIVEENLPADRCLVYEQPEGCTDDTPGINKLLREWEQAQKENPDIYDCLYLPAGVYWIDPAPGDEFGGIVLTDNQSLILSPSALIMTIPNSKSGYHVIYAFGRDNITISGGQIIGDRNAHTGGGEWGHGIEISGCTNVTIKDMEISQCWGDGIYLGRYGSQRANSRHVTVINCNLHHNRRNNLSITDADYITIDRCQFNYASGTDPQYGIDIEPNENDPCEHVTISNSVFKGNAKASMGIIKSANDIVLENCTLDGAFYNMAGKNVVLRNTTVKGEVVDSAGGIRYE